VDHACERPLEGEALGLYPFLEARRVVDDVEIERGLDRRQRALQ
jgi:hypothetical protein